MILILDNYDSFTYNLYQFIGCINEDILVKRNDKITIDEIKKLGPEKIILSPGPGYPADAGIMIDVIKNFYDKVPILGICLGHQAIGEAFGGNIKKASEVVHGKVREITLCEDELFNGIDEKINVTRYHSLVINKSNLPKDLIVIGTGEDEIMAIKHVHYPVYGLQFHPESYGTENGMKLIENFLRM
jgi:anthranilate synthase component 2